MLLWYNTKKASFFFCKNVFFSKLHLELILRRLINMSPDLQLEFLLSGISSNTALIPPWLIINQLTGGGSH